MSKSATVADILAHIQLLRLNVMPPYTLDDDEGRRSDEDYLSFYRDTIGDCIETARRYLQSLELLVAAPTSDEAFNQFMASRRQFIDTFPFCEDEFPAGSSSEYRSASTFLQSYFREGRIGRLDIETVRQYSLLLASLREELVAK